MSDQERRFQHFSNEELTYLGLVVLNSETLYRVNGIVSHVDVRLYDELRDELRYRSTDPDAIFTNLLDKLGLDVEGYVKITDRPERALDRFASL